MRRTVLALLLVVPACALNRTSQADNRCRAARPAGAQQFDIARVQQLAGDYRLVLINTTVVAAEPRIYDTLHLYAQDSIHRYQPRLGRTPGEQPLAGWVALRGPDGPWQRTIGSRDPDWPGVTYLARQQRLRIGIVEIDAAPTDLEITFTTATGFGGRWQAQTGIAIGVDRTTGRVLPAPAGYFCAQRLAGA